MSLTDTPAVEGTIEPDNDVIRAADGSDPRSQFQSWYHMSPGNYPALSPQSAYRSPYASSSSYVSPYAKQDAAASPQPPPAAVPRRQSPPPLGVVPIEPQSSNGTSYQQPSHLLQTTIPLDPTPDLSGQSPQTDTTSGLHSPELTTPPEGGIAALPPVSDPQGRQRCGEFSLLGPSMAVTSRILLTYSRPRGVAHDIQVGGRLDKDLLVRPG